MFKGNMNVFILINLFNCFNVYTWKPCHQQAKPLQTALFSTKSFFCNIFKFIKMILALSRTKLMYLREYDLLLTYGSKQNVNNSDTDIVTLTTLCQRVNIPIYCYNGYFTRLDSTRLDSLTHLLTHSLTHSLY